MTSRGYLPPVADRSGELREQLEKIQAALGPDTSLADVIRRALREYIQRHNDDALDAGYAAAVADNPYYPYESAEERDVLRARRGRRQEGESS